MRRGCSPHSDLAHGGRFPLIRPRSNLQLCFLRDLFAPSLPPLCSLSRCQPHPSLCVSAKFPPLYYESIIFDGRTDDANADTNLLCAPACRDHSSLFPATHDVSLGYCKRRLRKACASCYLFEDRNIESHFCRRPSAKNCLQEIYLQRRRNFEAAGLNAGGIHRSDSCRKMAAKTKCFDTDRRAIAVLSRLRDAVDLPSP